MHNVGTQRARSTEQALIACSYVERGVFFPYMMISLYLGVTGLHHQQHRLNASAHNTANTGVDEVEAVRLRASGRQHENGGVQTRTQQALSTDTLREVVVYIDSAQSFAAQVRVVQTQDDLLGTLLDIES